MGLFDIFKKNKETEEIEGNGNIIWCATPLFMLFLCLRIF